MRTFSFRQPCYLTEQEECISFNNELHHISFLFFFFYFQHSFNQWLRFKTIPSLIRRILWKQRLMLCCLVTVYFDLGLTIAIFKLHERILFFTLYFGQRLTIIEYIFFITLNFIKNSNRKKFFLNGINNIHLFCNYFFFYYRLLFITVLNSFNRYKILLN